MQPVLCNNEPKQPVIPDGSFNEDWLIPVDELTDISSPDRNHAYILPDNTVWVLSSDGTELIQLGCNCDSYYRGVIIFDSFNRADTVSGLGTPDFSKIGSVWEMLPGDTGIWRIETNVAKPITVTAPHSLPVIETGISNNFEVSCRFPSVGSGTSRVYFRVIDYSNHFFVGRSTLNRLEMKITVAGVTTTLATGATTMNSNGIIKVHCVDNIIEAYLNNNLEFVVVNNSFINATKHGIGSSTVISTTLDDFVFRTV